MKSIDKFYGCLIGGAAGDALGYEVEFDTERNIRTRYGPRGIHEYALTNGKAVISDDTQMTFFTANGLLLAAAQDNPDYEACISLAYQEWYRTQTEPYAVDMESPCWLMQVKELFRRRAPGNTCLTYCKSGAKGRVSHPVNKSCGCGGVMRTAPIGLFFDNKVYAPDWIAMVGAEAAAMTHGHPLGYIPSAALVDLINRITYDDITLRKAAEETADAMGRLFADTAGIALFTEMMTSAIRMSSTDRPCLECIHELGEGWTGHEAFVIALYCALKFENDFDMALCASVNHNGDSDSTGAITGNILGAYLGLSGIPGKYIDNLEMIEIAAALAKDLYDASEQTGDAWKAKYLTE